MAQAAQIIDFAQFRSRRDAAKASETRGVAMAPAFTAPVFWIPVWVFVSPAQATA